MRVYLTGGSGLLGSHLAERLRARGDEVVCLQRPHSDASFLSSLGCRIVHGDVRDGAALLRPGLEGCDAVVHSAALVYVGGPWPLISAVNVEGTTQLLRAAASARVERVVHVSSVAVYGGAPPQGETAPLEAPLAAGAFYARSKREAEGAARAAAAAGGLSLSILRPSALYGERDRLLTPRMARLLRLPVIPLLGPGDNTVPVTYAGNAAGALERVLDLGGADQAYDLGMDHPVTQRGFLEGLAHAAGRTQRFVRVPAGWVRQAARMARALDLDVPGGGDMTLERALHLTLGDNPYGNERIRTELAWSPAFGLAAGFERTMRWLEPKKGGRA